MKGPLVTLFSNTKPSRHPTGQVPFTAVICDSPADSAPQERVGGAAEGREGLEASHEIVEIGRALCHLEHIPLLQHLERQVENESWQTKRPRDRGEKPRRETERRGTDVKGGKGVAEAATEEAVKHCADQKLARPRGL